MGGENPGDEVGLSLPAPSLQVGEEGVQGPTKTGYLYSKERGNMYSFRTFSWIREFKNRI